MSHIYGTEHITTDHVVPYQDARIECLLARVAELERQLAIFTEAEKLQALKLQAAVTAQKYPAAQLHQVRP